MICKTGDIVIVPFPFSTLNQLKKRPALIISQEITSLLRGFVIALSITSQLKSSLNHGEYLIQNWKKSGLLKPSKVTPKVFTLETSLIENKLGSLSESEFHLCMQSFYSILGT
jgi:mRNA interferase MazF